MEQNEVHTAAVSRRGVLAGAGAGAALLAVAGCGGDGGSSSSSGGGEGGGGATGGGSGKTGGALATVADVPVGGAVSAKDSSGEPVIVAQPTEGQIVAFTAICTHKGCTVAPEGDQVVCPCHGSTYDLTGDNTGGPAPKPLAKIPVKVEGGKVVES